MLSEFNRRALIHALLANHELAAADRDHWDQTSRAMLALHSDKEETLETIIRHKTELNACFIATRMLAEGALCESPVTGGVIPGRLDLSRLMSRAAQIFY